LISAVKTELYDSLPYRKDVGADYTLVDEIAERLWEEFENGQEYGNFKRQIQSLVSNIKRDSHKEGVRIYAYKPDNKYEVLSTDKKWAPMDQEDAVQQIVSKLNSFYVSTQLNGRNSKELAESLRYSLKLIRSTTK